MSTVRRLTPTTRIGAGLTMPTDVRDVFERELSAARKADTAEQRWQAMERAHIVSQPWPWPHTRAHLAMFAQAVREHDRKETLGQVVRLLVAAPGSAMGRYPEGNTGRATVGITAAMPVPEDLERLLARHAVR